MKNGREKMYTENVVNRFLFLVYHSDEADLLSIYSCNKSSVHFDNFGFICLLKYCVRSVFVPCRYKYQNK